MKEIIYLFMKIILCPKYEMFGLWIKSIINQSFAF